MKHALIVLMLTIFVASSQAQNDYTEELMNSIKDQYALDDNNNLTYVRVIDVPEVTKKDIYKRAEAWFIYNYGSGKAVIQSQDTSSGTIIGKGRFDNVHRGMYMLTTVECDAWHIIRVDVKDNKCRVIVTLTEWERTQHGSNGAATWPKTSVASEYPINKRGRVKNLMGHAFYNLHKLVEKTFQSLESAVKEGNTSKEIEGKDW